MIYLDNAATTKPNTEAVKRALEYMTDEYGNAGSVHSKGVKAYLGVVNSKLEIARHISANPEQIIFTSSGSEANNLAIQGVLSGKLKNSSNNIVTSKIEHESVKKAVEKCFERDLIKKCIYVSPNSEGIISVDDVRNSIDGDTCLVSIMYVNNETGSVNPVKEIGKLCKDKGILFHVDAVQALSCMDINVNDINCDLMSFSAHKIHGLKGVGALYVRDKSMISSIISGGTSQEFGLRGGTENVPGIVAFGEAIKQLQYNNHRARNNYRRQFFLSLHYYLHKIGLEPKDVISVNGVNDMSAVDKYSPHILNIRCNGVDAETLLLFADSKGVCVSAGSACTSHEMSPSTVLKSMGLTDDAASSSIRISFSYYTTDEEVQEGAKIIAECIKELKKNKKMYICQ